MKTETTILDALFKRLQLGDDGRPLVERLEYNSDQRMVLVELQGKEGVGLIPLENVAGMVPLMKGENIELTTAERKQELAVQAALEEQKRRDKVAKDKADAAKQRALDAANSAQKQRDVMKEAERVRAEYRKNHPDESTPFPAGYEPPPVATKLGMRLGETPEEPEPVEFQKEMKGEFVEPKPKKRKTRKDKGKPRKKKEATT